MSTPSAARSPRTALSLPAWLRTPLFPLLLLALLPTVVIAPAVVEQAENAIGIVIAQNAPGQAIQIGHVRNHSPAGQAGLKAGSVLLEAMDEPVTSLAEMNRLWLKRQDGQPLKLLVQSPEGETQTFQILPGITPDFTPAILHFLGAFFFLGLIGLLLPQWKKPQARLLVLMLALLSTDFLLPYNYAGSWDSGLWHFNLFNLVAVNLVTIHFFLIFPGPLPFYRRWRLWLLLLIYGLLLPTGFLLAASVGDPANIWDSLPVYALDAVLVLLSWLLLGLRLLDTFSAGNPMLARWVWLFYTPFALSKAIWFVLIYTGQETSITINALLVPASTILAPAGIFLAVTRMNFLEAGQKLREPVFTPFLRIILFTLGLLLAQQILFRAEAHHPLLAPALAVMGSSLWAVLVWPLAERLRNWLVRGIFTPENLTMEASESFFLHHETTRDEGRLLQEAAAFAQKQFRLPWVALIHHFGKDEIMALSPSDPQRNKAFAALLQELERHIQGQNPATHAAWMAPHGVDCVLPMQHGTETSGWLVAGLKPDVPPLSSHQQADLQVFLRRLARQLQRVQLEKTASMDELTGALRREAGLQQMHRALEQAFRQRQPLGVALLDLDYFKQINDEHGHLAGDQVLRETASVIRRQLRQRDFLCRYGGEEFLLVFPDTGHKGCKTALEKLRQAISRHYILIGKGERKLHVTISAGGCCLSPSEEHSQASTEKLARRMVEQADTLMYQAKRMGRNRVYCEPFKP